jgi:hypothetical protein
VFVYTLQYDRFAGAEHARMTRVYDDSMCEGSPFSGCHGEKKARVHVLLRKKV